MNVNICLIIVQDYYVFTFTAAFYIHVCYEWSGVAIHRAELTHLPKITFQIQIKYGFKSHCSQLLVFAMT